MAGFNLSGRSREGLLLALFLVGAIAAASGTIVINNYSNNFVGLVDINSFTVAAQIPPGSQLTRDFAFSGNVTETHMTFFQYYHVAPNSSAVSGDVYAFASALLFDNATVTFTTQVGWTTVGVIVEYAS